MANSRLEKIGTIYTRTKGLIECGTMNWIDRPLWYDLYEAFPPKEEPRFDRPAPNLPIRKIFYEEDKIKAKFHNANKHLGAVNLLNNKTKSLSQHFVDTYKKVAENNKDGSEEQILEDALEVLKSERAARKDYESTSLLTAFKDARDTKRNELEKINVNITNIFKSNVEK